MQLVQDVMTPSVISINEEATIDAAMELVVPKELAAFPLSTISAALLA
jgi:CBS domain-containing protein